MRKSILFLLLMLSVSASAQTATVDWAQQQQYIDGFGGADAQQGVSMTAANQTTFFSTLGYSILRVGITDGSVDPGSCLSVDVFPATTCAGAYVSDMQACIANGCKVYGTPWSPPPIYKTNGNAWCTFGTGNGALASGVAFSASTSPSNAGGNSWVYTFAASNVGAGLSGGWVGAPLVISGYTGSATGNNGTFTVTASTSTTVTVTNTTGTTANTGTPVFSLYQAFAAWLSNFVQSLAAQSPSIPMYALSVQNEPEGCHTYDSAEWTGAQFDTFITANLGPTFASAGISTLIFQPEVGGYNQLSASIAGSTGIFGDACALDPACFAYLGGFNYHGYQVVTTDPKYANDYNYAMLPQPLPPSWPTSKKYWETEDSCLSPTSPNFCIVNNGTGFNNYIPNALLWNAVVDQAMTDGANMWLWWWLNANSSEGLMNTAPGTVGTLALRAYALAQYAKFVRPGYYKIAATHRPQYGTTVTAYQSIPSNTLVIIASNNLPYNVSMPFSLINAPTVSSCTPTQTSATNSLTTLSAATVTAQAFTYQLPNQSITTFVCATSGSAPTPAAVAYGGLANGHLANGAGIE